MTRPAVTIRRKGSKKKADPEGAMPLTDHLRELRSRLSKSLLAIFLGMVVGWIYYDELFGLIRAPFDAVVAEAEAAGRDMTLAFTGVADPFVMQLKVAGVAGLLLASPIWIYQLWRFLVPGLTGNERRWGLAFAAVATPLFLSGAYLAYTVMPKGLEILLGFTPEAVENIISVDKYLSFFLRMMVVFGIGFLLPLLVVALNFAGVLPASKLRSWWRWIVMGVVVFAAVATPTGDPFNLMVLTLPLLMLMGLAWMVAWLNDRRRARRAKDEPQWDDDETSPLDETPSPIGEDETAPLGG